MKHNVLNIREFAFHAVMNLVGNRMTLCQWLVTIYLNLQINIDFIAKHSGTKLSLIHILHALLSAIPLRPYAQEEVAGEIVRLREEGVLCAAEAESIRPAHIAAFFASPLGRRLLASETVRRELEFNYRVSARHLLGADTDEPILLQGVIDCCFLEEGAWVLLDYKTDFVPPGTTPEEAAAKHARQLTLYAEALAALTATPVREAYICLLGIGENVRLL